MPSLIAQNLTYSYSSKIKPALSNVSLYLEPGTLTALVGYNEGPRYAKNYKEDYIINSRYVTKVMNYLDSFDTTTEMAGI